MKIVADENIPLLQRFFGELGEIISLPGREISAPHLQGADILLVRSVTRVDEQLLAGSRVHFVGTATIGTDHVDLDYLSQNGIGFANAPGSNANSVVEYVLSCLSILTETHGMDWDQLTVGIVGYGNVGSTLARRLQKLGICYRAFDPLIAQDSDPALGSFDSVLACDVISLHVPLTLEGEHRTLHLFDQDLLRRLAPHQVLINTSRGAVIDNRALAILLQQPESFSAILDVWENEPAIDPELARRVLVGTPHIAGYSFDGKVAGVEMVYFALCQYLGLPVRHRAAQFLEEPPLSKMTFTSNADLHWCIHTAIRACFDVRHDHGLLRQSLCLPEVERSAQFDCLRRDYRCRREFSGVKIQLKKAHSELHSTFRALGFNVKH
jgi:erythronate-4-phosphate dehydrogenase